MSIVRLCRNAVHFREFQNDPVTGHHYTATCGETVLATAIVCATPETESTEQAIDLMTSLTREMMARGWADKPDGNSTMAHLRDELVLRGFSYDTATFRSFQQPLDASWLHALLRKEAGNRPVVLEIARAGNLDAIDGSHDERGVNYHYIGVLGIDDQGRFVCNDGDNSAIAQHLVIYTWDEIWSAVPCAAMVVNLKEGSFEAAMLDINNPTVKNYFFLNSAGQWQRRDRADIHIMGAILEDYRSDPGGQLNGLTTLGLPITGEIVVFPGTTDQHKAPVRVQVFECGARAYDPYLVLGGRPGLPKGKAVYPAHIEGSPVLDVLDATLHQQLTQAQQAAANAQAAALKAQQDLQAAEERFQEQLQQALATAGDTTALQQQLATAQQQLAQAQADLEAARQAQRTAETQLAAVQSESAKALALVTALRELLAEPPLPFPN